MASNPTRRELGDSMSKGKTNKERVKSESVQRREAIQKGAPTRRELDEWLAKRILRASKVAIVTMSAGPDMYGEDDEDGSVTVSPVLIRAPTHSLDVVWRAVDEELDVHFFYGDNQTTVELSGGTEAYVICADEPDPMKRAAYALGLAIWEAGHATS